MKNIKISVEEQSKIFKKHLDEQDNERIIFSAAFGAGKTYFLKNFFSVNTSEYLTVSLAPVNYSIASNEDIFKLIKFDILFELLAHHGAKQPGKIKIRPDIYYGLKLTEKVDGFFTSAAALFGVLNKDTDDATKAITALSVLYSQINDFTVANPEIKENPEVNIFLEQMLNTYFKEADDITAFIESVLNQLSEAPEHEEGEERQKDRKKVLVIDDLDRLDPEHIFRLFNVFSAHFDYNQSNRNKFGFNKVIFVCDIQNIRNIFHSRYGAETDFSGYIDKFFSQEIYHFNNENAVKNYVDKLLASIQVEDKEGYERDYFLSHILQGANYREKWIAFWVLFESVVSGALKPRRIFSPHKAWNFPQDIIKIRTQCHPIEEYVSNVPTIISIQLLSSIFGGGEQLLRATKHIASQHRSIEYHNTADNASYIERLTESLLIVDFHNHMFQLNNESHQPKNHLYSHPDGRTINYNVYQPTNYRNSYRTRIIDNPQGLLFFEILPVMVQKLLNYKIIK